jgi:hypothetical protein
MYSCLSRLFNGTRSLGVKHQEKLPCGKYGREMPEAMVAITAVAVSGSYPSRWPDVDSTFWSSSRRHWRNGKRKSIPSYHSRNRATVRPTVTTWSWWQRLRWVTRVILSIRGWCQQFTTKPCKLHILISISTFTKHFSLLVSKTETTKSNAVQTDLTDVDIDGMAE